MRGYKCSCCGSVVNELSETNETAAASAPSSSSSSALCHGCDGLTDEQVISLHTIPTATPICALEADETFRGLTDRERWYAYWIARASWDGSLICLTQTSPESAPIFCLLLAAFRAQPIEELLSTALASGLTEEEVNFAMTYAAAFLSNMGNYKSMGDSKFVPQLPLHRMRAFLECSKCDRDVLSHYLRLSCPRMYSLPLRHRQIGLGADKGVSTYFSANCDAKDAELAGRFLRSIGMSPYNTRLFKQQQQQEAGGSSGSSTKYSVLVASASSDPANVTERSFTFEGCEFELRFGDHAAHMDAIASALSNAIEFAANSTQEAMLRAYADSFRHGSIDAHKEGSRQWIRDKGPTVESYIGFIESYRDPSGERGEWEGFVACVNKEASKKFQALVDSAESLLTLMPWPRDFEKDKFFRPDFTSLDILAFGSSGVPAGINIPNYDDIRQNEGFKNVSLGNVLKAGYGAGGAKPVSFIASHDQDNYKKLMGAAFEVQVGVHELLGHGSGKLFTRGEGEDARSQLVNPVTGGACGCYEKGETWDSVFGRLASGYEECRAECCGLYLSLDRTVLNIFGHVEEAEQDDISYINWLLMCRAGVVGLEFYTPETKGWRQAHMNARYVILRVLMEAGEGLVKIARKVGSDGKPDIEIQLDRSKIHTVGREAIGRFLMKLQVHKSTANLAEGGAMFESYSAVDDEMLQLRAIVMDRKEPRRLLLQPNLVVEEEGGAVSLRGYPSTAAGMVQSYLDRFQHVDLAAVSEAAELEAPFVDDLEYFNA